MAEGNLKNFFYLAGLIRGESAASECYKVVVDKKIACIIETMSRQRMLLKFKKR